MRDSAAEFLSRDFLSRDRLDDGRARDEHLARALHHEDEVRQSRAVDSAASARSHDDGNLRDNARSRRVAVEDAGIAGECVNGFLDAGAARIVDADARCAHLHREILNLPDLVRVLLAERAARDREVLSKCVDEAAVNRAVARDNTVGREILFLHAEVRAAMLHEHIEFDERAFIKELLEALAGRVLALRMLLVDALLAARLADVLFLGVHLFNFFLNGCHVYPPNISQSNCILICVISACQQGLQDPLGESQSRWQSSRRTPCDAFG